uniref:Hemolysin-type calcium-binding region n=2 Tax=Magnetospirillum gryphiswaldense TaxID=55518 RepID=A4U2R3_9PROT|nr:Hemolysin-type calcium-binding region [Magnetospirillum gryphiswaldense MSR-1]
MASIQQAASGDVPVGTGAGAQSTNDLVKQAIQQAIGGGTIGTGTTGPSGSSSGGVSSDLGQDTQTPNTPTNTTPTTTNGRLVDGPIYNAEVFLDVDGDGAYDSGEPVTFTDANGYYTLAGAGAYQIVAKSGGIDTVTGQVIQFDMKAPAGSTIVSPLTTLVAELGEAAVKTMLGITSTASLLTTDPMTNSDIYPDIYAAGAQLVATINVLKNGLGLNQQQVLDAIVSVMQGEVNNNTPTANFLTDTNALTTVVSASGASSGYSNSGTFITHVAQASAAARSDPQNPAVINPVTTEAGGVISVNTADADSVAANITGLKAGGLTTFNLMSGVSSLTAAEAGGVTFTYPTGSSASMGVSDNAAAIGAYADGFSGIKSIAVTGGGTVYYSNEKFIALEAITTGADDMGVYLENGDSLAGWSSADFAKLSQVKIAAGATVTMTADQVNLFEQNSMFGWSITKEGGAKLHIAISGNVSGMLLGAADEFVLTGDATIARNFFTSKPINKGAFSLTVDTGSYSLAGVDLTNADAVKINNVVIDFRDGDEVQAHWAALTGAEISTFALTSGRLELTAAQASDVAVSVSGDATFWLVDTGANLSGKLGLYSGVTDYRVISGDLSIDAAEASLHGAHITRAAGANVVLALVSGDNATGLTGFNQISLTSGYAFVPGATILALGASNIALSGGAFLKAVVSGNVVGNDYSPATVLYLSGDVTLSVAQRLVYDDNQIYANGYKMALSGVSGDVSTVDFYNITGVSLSGDASWTMSQELDLQGFVATITDNGHGVTLTAVHGLFELDPAKLSHVDSMVLSGELSIELADYAALLDDGIVFDAGTGTISLTAVSGVVELNAAELGLVHALALTGDTTLTLAQFDALMDNEATVDDGTGTFDLTVSGISGSLTLSDIALGAVDGLALSGNLSLTFTQFQDLLSRGITFDKDTYTLTVTGVSGDLTGLDLSAVDAIVTTGSVILSPDQVSGLTITGSGSVVTQYDNASTGIDETFQALAGEHLQFHGGIGDYRFDMIDGALVITDLRDQATADYDGTDTIEGWDQLGGPFVLHFSDDTATLTCDGDLYLTFGSSANTVRLGGIFDTVRLGDGNDLLVLSEDHPLTAVLDGEGGTDTIVADGAIDLTGRSLSSFEALKGSGDQSSITLNAAQLSSKTVDGADSDLSVVVAVSGTATLSSDITVTNWAEGDSLIFRGRKDLADIMGGTNAAATYEVSGDDQANGGTSGDVYELSVGENSEAPFAGNIVITDAGGTDTIDVRVLSENTGKDYAFDGALRVGDDLVIYLDPAAGIGGGTITINDHFNGKGVERLQTESSGDDMYEYLATGLSGTALDEMIFGTNKNATVETLTGGGGHDQFFGGGGLDSFVGDGFDTVHYGALGGFNAGTGGLVMNAALDAAGNGAATLNDGLGGSWTQTYQGIGEIVGTDGADQLYGWTAPVGDRKFTLNGGRGSDHLIGGAGTIADYSDEYRVSEGGAGIRIDVNNVAGTYTGTVVTSAGTDLTEGILHFVGSAFNDWFEGSDGNETFQGNGGRDTIHGNDGWDTITFFDTENHGVTVNLNGSSGNDGFGDSDDISGIEHVIGSKYGDELNGGDGNERLDGRDGDDTITGGGGVDTIVGGAGQDSLTGGSGSDIFIVENASQSTVAATDTVTDFGTGQDQVWFTGAAGYAYSTAINASGADDLAAAIALVTAGVANNTIAFFTWGGDGYLYVKGTGSGISFDQTLIRLQGVSAAPSRDGNDAFVSTATATMGADEMYGTAGADSISSLGGNDTIYGLGGDDTLHGGAGDDLLHGGDGSDVIYYTDSSLSVAVNLGMGTASGDESGFDTLTSIEAVVGSQGADTIIGSSANETLDGYHGADELTGGGGADLFVISHPVQSNLASGYDHIMDFGTGNDTILLKGGAGYTLETVAATGVTLEQAVASVEALMTPDSIAYFEWEGGAYLYVSGTGSGSVDFGGTLVQIPVQAGAVTLSGGNTILAATGASVVADILVGSDGVDVIDALAGDDDITGGAGADILTGGAGDDTFLYASASDGGDVITDFTAGGSEDALSLQNLVLNTVFQHVSTNGVVHPQAGVVVLDDVVASNTHLQAATVAAKLNGLSGVGHEETALLFALSDGSSTAIWKWADSNSSAQADNGELTLIATLTGVQASQLTYQDFLGSDTYSATPTISADFLVGTSAKDVFDAGDGDDIIITNGGEDTVSCGAGNDMVYAPAADLPGMSISGGSGLDTLVVSGSGSVDLTGLSFTGIDGIWFQGSQPGTNHISAVIFDAASFAANIQSIDQNGRSFFQLTTGDGNGENEIDVTIDATVGGDLSAMSLGFMPWMVSNLVIDGQSATESLTAWVPGEGMCAATLYGGSADDVLKIGGMISDFKAVVRGGEGADTVVVTDAYVNHNGTIDGGDGIDVLTLQGASTLGGALVENIELIDLSEAEVANGVIDALQGTHIDGGGGASDLTIRMATGAFDLSAIEFVDWGNDDTLTVIGSVGSDTITGTSHDETISGGVGVDSIDISGGGADTILFTSSSLSVGELGRDTVTGFAADDSFILDHRIFALGSSGTLDPTRFAISTALTGNLGDDIAGIVVVGAASGSDGVDIWFTTKLSDVSEGNSTRIGTLAGVNTSLITAAHFALADLTSNTPSVGADVINGSAGTDIIDALAGDDVINGNGGQDTLRGGGGNDSITLTGLVTGTTVAGGLGTDMLTIVASGAVNLQDVGISGIETFDFAHAGVGEEITSVSIGANILANNFSAVWSEGNSYVGLSNTSGTGLDLTIDAGVYSDLADMLDYLSLDGFDRLVIDGSANASPLTAKVMSGLDQQTILGGTGADEIDALSVITSSQSLEISTGDGADTITVGGEASLSNTVIDGGDGIDTLAFTGLSSMGAPGYLGTISNIEVIDLTVANATNAIAYARIDGSAANTAVTIRYGHRSSDLAFQDWGADDSLTLVGSGDDNTLTGGVGVDTLIGDEGNDELTGGAGADLFLFTRSQGTSSFGTDTITDFSSGDGDKIGLDVGYFFDLDFLAGQLDAGSFHFGTDWSEISGSGAGIVVLGQNSGSDGVGVYYTSDVNADGGPEAYQIATISGANTSTISNANFTSYLAPGSE